MDGKELARLVSSINLRCVSKISDSVMNKDTLRFCSFSNCCIVLIPFYNLTAAR